MIMSGVKITPVFFKDPWVEIDTIKDIKENTLLEQSINNITLNKFNEQNTIIIGEKLAASLHLKIGDDL